MKCPRCDANLADDTEVCNFCGQGLGMVHYAVRMSNAYYNMGLEKARVRDLSGAVLVLKKGLEFNKYNTNARNLLGLIYNEMGETVAALSEWVLSRYLQPEDNRAEYYIGVVRRNQSALDTINQTIKKYNSALSAAKSGNEDLAVIQLKKVVSLNPKFVRAHQLLALLYMKASDYPKAVKCLKWARKIDFNNTTTLRYMQEIGEKFTEPGRGRDNAARAYRQPPKKDPLANVRPVGTYKEEKRHWMPAVNVIIGIMIGLVVSFVLIRPTLTGNLASNHSESIAENNQMLSVKEAEISAIEQERDQYKQNAEKLQKKFDDEKNANKGKLERSEKLLLAAKYYTDGELVLAATAVNGYTEADFESEDEKALFQKVSKKLTSQDVQKLFEEGRDLFNTRKYDEAEQVLTQVLSIEPENQDALYFMGRVYHQQEKKKKAKEYYQKVLDVDDTTSRAAEARNRISQLGSGR